MRGFGSIVAAGLADDGHWIHSDSGRYDDTGVYVGRDVGAAAKSSATELGVHQVVVADDVGEACHVEGVLVGVQTAVVLGCHEASLRKMLLPTVPPIPSALNSRNDCMAARCCSVDAGQTRARGIDEGVRSATNVAAGASEGREVRLRGERRKDGDRLGRTATSRFI